MAIDLSQVPTELLVQELILRGVELPVRPIRLDWDEIEAALRLVDIEASLSFIYDEVIPAGVSGWVEAALPVGRVGATRWYIEWGDPCVKVAHAYDNKERLYVKLHFVPPTPTRIEKMKYWDRLSSKWFLYRENTDPVNPAEYHLISAALLPRAEDWRRIHAKMVELAERVLR